MATKAELARAATERSGPKKPKKAARPRRDLEVDTSKPGVSETDRKAGKGATAKRNASKRAAKKGGPRLEDSQTKPSRKSTRRSSGGIKSATNLQRRATRKTTAPKARAKRSAVAAKRGKRG